MIYDIKFQKKIKGELYIHEDKINLCGITELKGTLIKNIENDRILEIIKEYMVDYSQIIPKELNELFNNDNFDSVKVTIKDSKFTLIRPDDNYRKLLQLFLDNFTGYITIDEYSNSVLIFSNYKIKCNIVISNGGLYNYVDNKLEEIVTDFNSKEISDHEIELLYYDIIERGEKK